MKRSDFSKPLHYDFANLLEEANNHKGDKNTSLIYRDFVTLASCTMRQASHKLLNGVLDDTVEAEYMRTIKKYPKPDKMAYALAVLVNGLEETCYDFLGSVYMEMNMGNKNSAQFFTPRALSDICAKMTFQFTKESFAAKYPAYGISRPRFTVNDPCIGGGSMLISIVQCLREVDAHPRQWWFEAIDVDPMCAQMAFIQLSLLGAPGVVYVGNTLGQNAGQDNPPWFTTTGALFPLTDGQREANAKPEMEIEIVAPKRKGFKLPNRKKP